MLERWVRARTSPQRLVLRSRIVLLAAAGDSKATIAKRLGTTTQTVRLWWLRFGRGGPAALSRDAPGRGRKPRVSSTSIAQALRETSDRPLSVRKLAQRLGTSSSAVQRAITARRTEGQFRNKKHSE